MAIPRHVDQAAARVQEAGRRIEAARQQPLSLESAREWLEALTDFTLALSDIQAFNNESVHEKLHQLAARMGVKSFPTSGLL